MRVLIVDDDSGIRWILDKVLQEEGFDVVQAESMQQAKDALTGDPFALVFLDVYLPDGNGMEAMKGGLFDAPVVLLTAETTFDHAAQAYRSGAMEYLPKPFDLEEVRALARRIKPEEEKASTPDSKAASQTEPGTNKDLIIGRSPAMQHLFRTLGRVAASDLTVLITGESGTGKELVAQVLHRQSRRADHPLVSINTAAIPAELLEAELFGHEKGAFTGADKMRIGHFEKASGGTLFLDEIGDMPASLQVKLLRVLEEGVIQRIGGREDRKVNVRLLAATHQNLQQKIETGAFREDLFYRLNVIPVHIPALRERKDDIRQLADTLLDAAGKELAMQPPILLDEALDLLQSYDWPGNVRELKNVMRRLALLTPGAAITLSDVALALGHQDQNNDHDESLSDAVSRCLRKYIAHLGHAEAENLHSHLLAEVEPPLLMLVMERCKGNQIKAADMLGVNRNTVRKMLRQYHIDPHYFKE
ncbi:MAG: sigma-54 dependent transcriptional regulator [Mariprofundaceae bacterium]